MIIRQLTGAFDPVYLKPRVLAGAAQHLIPSTTALAVSLGIEGRNGRERRLHKDRRQRQQAVLLELRSPHSRRTATGRRHHDVLHGRDNSTGIDTFA